MPWIPPAQERPQWGGGPEPAAQWTATDWGTPIRRASTGRRWRALAAALVIVGLAIGAGSLAAVRLSPTPAHQTKTQGSFAPSPGASPASSDQDLAAVATSDLPEIVTIVAIGRQSDELGTGWPIDGSGDFITNDHVVHAGISFYAVTQTGAEYPASVINADPALDLAEVKVIGLREQPFEIDPNPAALGEPVVVLASEGATSHPPVTESVVDGLGERATVEHAEPGELSNYSDLIRIPAKIFPGNSGGPVLTTAGQVVGVLTLAAEDGPGAFAMPLQELSPVIHRWLEG